MPTFDQAPAARAQMLIRKPAREVFNAIIDPAITTHFWFTKSSGKLEAGRRVRWDWEMYGVHDEVEVKEFETNKRLVFEWSFPNSSRVEWTFDARPDGTTFVSVVNSDFKGDDIVTQALESTGGFNLVLCACKAFLEHGIEPGFVADRAPDANVHGRVAAGKRRSRGQATERKAGGS